MIETNIKKINTQVTQEIADKDNDEQVNISMQIEEELKSLKKLEVGLPRRF